MSLQQPHVGARRTAAVRLTTGIVLVAGCCILAALPGGIRTDEGTNPRAALGQEPDTAAKQRPAERHENARNRHVSVDAYVSPESAITQRSAGPGNLSTGFEPGDGFSAGPISGQAGWSAFQVAAPEGHIDTVNPATGSQHLRISQDPGLPPGTNTGAFSPDLGPLATGASTTSVDVAISATDGADYFVVGQSPSEGFLAWEVDFGWLGQIFVVDDLGAGLVFVDTGTTWTVGSYQNLTVCDDPVAGTTDYYYNGALIYSQVTHLPGTRVEQVVIFSDNWHVTDEGDFDNLTVQSGLSGVCTAGPEISLVPVGGVGNEITVPFGGTRVELELFVSDWDPARLAAYQVTIDPAGYGSGDQGTANPATEACSTNADCEAAFGPGAKCFDLDSDTVPDTCSAAKIDTSRADYVFTGVTQFDAVDPFDPFGLGIRLAATVFFSPGDAVTDPGVPRYIGTLILDLSDDAAGDFTISMRPDPDSFLADENGAVITPVQLTPALITVEAAEACCLPDGSCVELAPAECSLQGGLSQGSGSLCLGDSNGDGTDDACEDLIDPDEALVTFNPGTSQAVAEQILADAGIGILEFYENLNSYHITVAFGMTVDETVDLLNQNPNVNAASATGSESEGAHLTIPNDPQFPGQWALDNTGRNVLTVTVPPLPPAPAAGFTNGGVGVIDADIDSPQAWEHTWDCRNEIVAIIDSGLDTTAGTRHTDFGGIFPAGNIWLNPGDPTSNGVDNDGNGIIDDVNGANFAAYEMYANRVAPAAYTVGDWVILDNDADRVISVGDLRITGTLGGLIAGSTVVAGDADIPPAQAAPIALTDFVGTRHRHVDNGATANRFDNGEWIFLDIPNAALPGRGLGVVSAGDVRLTPTIAPLVPGLVLGGDADVATVLVRFVRVFNNNTRDVVGHGTNVAGVIGAFGNNGMNLAGVCWRVQLLPLKTARPNGGIGSSRIPDVIAAINYVVALKTRAANPVNVRIINYSSGGVARRGRGFFAARRSALAAANAAGILFVTTAGNNSRDNDGGGPETIYRDVGAGNPGVVGVGDVRLGGLRIGGTTFFAGSVVAAGDGDVGLVLVAFAANERHADPDGSLNYTPGEAIYRGANPVAGGDRRLSFVSAGGGQYGPGSRVIGGAFPDPDVGTALIAFLANERHTELVPANGLLASQRGNVPCSYDLPNIVCVAASDNRDNLATFSAWGTRSVDVAAPGVDILLLQQGGGTTFANGTSFSAPHVAGIAAHFWSLPGFTTHTVAQLKTRLLTGTNGPLSVPHPHGVDPRFGIFGVLSGPFNDGRARMTMGDDFGDAPDLPYPTRLADQIPGNHAEPHAEVRWGARHEDIGEEWLGRAADLPPDLNAPPGASDVSPEFDAFNDPHWPPDPDGIQNLVDTDAHDDGIILVGPFRFSPIAGPPVVARVDVFVDTENNAVIDHDGGRYTPNGHGATDGVHGPFDDKFVWVNGFFDWNGDGDWNDFAEHVFTIRADPSTWAPLTSGGYYIVNFNMPPAPVPIVGPNIWARFRLDYGENLGQLLAPPNFPVGPSAGGLIDFWDVPGLPFLKGAYVPNRYESVFVGGMPDLDLKLGVAQFGEVEDYLLERDHFPESKAELSFSTPFGSETVTLVGPTTVIVNLSSLGDADGNGLEEVQTEIVGMELTGASALLGVITVRVRPESSSPFLRTFGQIEEKTNDIPGVLELPGVPGFTGDTGAAATFFDVYFEIEVAGDIYHNEQPKHMETQITEKPPAEGETYESPEVIPLFDEAGSFSGIELENVSHTPRTPDEVDFFPESKAIIAISSPSGSEEITLIGPTTVIVRDVRTPQDANGNGLDEVTTEIVQMELTGISAIFGPITVRVRPETSAPFLRTIGQIEENSNDTPGVLELPGVPNFPGTTGAAATFFDVYFEIEVAGETLHNIDPKRMETEITEKPPAEGETYEAPEVIPLFDEAGNITPISLSNLSHTPNPDRPPDPHQTEPGPGVSSTTFGNDVIPAISADFFGPGSDPFTGDVAMEGVPLDPADPGTSTLIVRSGDPIQPSDPIGTEGTVGVELVALSLKSIDPITVTYNGGQNPELWDVSVELSDVSAPSGSLTATKTHENGGTFDMILPVNTKLTFTNTDNPSDVRVLDSAIEGIEPIQLATQTPADWVHELDAALQGTIQAPFNGVFVPGVRETPGGGARAANSVKRPAPTHSGINVRADQQIVTETQSGGTDNARTRRLRDKTSPPNARLLGGLGACCLTDDSCFDDFDQATCELELEGVFQGAGTACADVLCGGCTNDAECDDGDACTNDACDLATGECVNGPNYDVTAQCCDPATGVVTVIDDGDPCTDDLCDAATGAVSHVPVPDGTTCDDGAPCTTNDACVGGSCSGQDINGLPCDTNADCPPPGNCDDNGQCVCGGPAEQVVVPILLEDPSAQTRHTITPPPPPLQTGACCDHYDGQCIDGLTESDCNLMAIQPEFFKDEFCADVNCDIHKGACCYKRRGRWTCRITDKPGCDALPDSSFLGHDTDCPKGKKNKHKGVAIIHYSRSSKACEGAGGLRGQPCVAGMDPVDPWVTDTDPQTCHQFGDAYEPESPKIPADFFGPGSDPFEGQVCLENDQLGDLFLPGDPDPPMDFGNADTLVQRSADPFARCDPPGATEVTVDVEVVALSLKSIDPITVTYNGGQNPQQWNVVVDLSVVTPPPGSLTAVKTHCNGGTFRSELHIQPRLTFTEVTNPGNVRVLDTGLEGIPFTTLEQPDPTDPQDPDPVWIHDLPPGDFWASPICSDFHPGLDNPVPPAGCGCESLSPPILAPPPHDADKNRYISFDPNNGATPVAMQVTLSDGRICWVDEPCLVADTNNVDPQWVAECVESAAGDGTDMTRDWSGYTDPATGNPVVHVRGCVILPDESYDVRTMAVDGALSAPLTLGTVPAPAIGSWGDIVGDFVGGAWTEPNSNTNFKDVAAGIQGFQQLPTAAPVTWVDLVPAEAAPNYVINFNDIGAIIKGFLNVPYPGTVSACAIPAASGGCP